MTVTRIEEMDKRRSKIYINHEFAFVLYKGEMKQFKIEEGENIADCFYDEIMEKVLPVRAKKRCLSLLEKRPYTEYKLRQKLVEGNYPSQIIEEAISYVKSFHYIDDYSYACEYIFYHKESESKRKIEEKLLLRGIPKEIMEKAFEESYFDEYMQQEMETKQAIKLLEKKKYNALSADWREKQKIYAFLARKGISSQIIVKVLDLRS